MDSKKWYFSRTVWVAILQAIIGFLVGIVAVLNDGLSETAIAALSVGAKGVFDLYLRLKTSQPIL